MASRSGHTIVEALCAALIIGVTVIAIGAAFSSGTLIMGNLLEREAASAALCEKMSSIRGTEFDSIQGGTFVGGSFDHLSSPAGVATVSLYSGNSDIKQVTLRVTWQSRLGGTRALTTSTLVTKGGVNRQ